MQPPQSVLVGLEHSCPLRSPLSGGFSAELFSMSAAKLRETEWGADVSSMHLHFFLLRNQNGMYFPSRNSLLLDTMLNQVGGGRASLKHPFPLCLIGKLGCQTTQLRFPRSIGS